MLFTANIFWINSSICRAPSLDYSFPFHPPSKCRLHTFLNPSLFVFSPQLCPFQPLGYTKIGGIGRWKKNPVDLGPSFSPSLCKIQTFIISNTHLNTCTYEHGPGIIYSIHSHVWILVVSTRISLDEGLRRKQKTCQIQLIDLIHEQGKKWILRYQT